MSEWKTGDEYYTAVTQGLRKRLQRLIDPGSRWIDRVGGRLRDPLWWQRTPVWAGALGAVVLVAAAGAWWWQAAASADRQVALALQHLRSGRHQDALDLVRPVCQSWVRREACFVRDKAALGLQLERPEVLELEQFAAQIDALKAHARDDPDLRFLSAQLTLSQNQPALHAAAKDEIARAIEATGGRFPEAHFYLANLALMDARPADALPLLERALDPAVNKVAPAHYLNARAYARAQTGDLPGALQDYERSAELGSILSRIELAQLLWRMSEFERASDQLQAAARALGDAAQPLAGRNALPWAFETASGAVVLLRQAQEKRCFARWMLRAGLALAGRAAPDGPADWADCGPEATRIAAAVAGSLARASGAGMDDTGRERALRFAREHRL
jgi:tetratricopeptide (TPR) repeat protein